LNKDIAFRWIWKADRDFLVAAQLDDSFSDMAAYHYQQAAEKYLKAFLSFHQVGLKKTHNIGTLALQASNIDPAFTKLVTVADVDAITEFATLFRYPNEEEIDFPDPVELQEAKMFCEVAKQLVIERIAASGDAP
jgi:HEPN domain-containing protein